MKCEKVAFSPAALGALVRRGQRDVNKESMLQVLEFCTGIQRHTHVSTKPDELPKLYAEMSSLNESFGRRGRDLALPPDWKVAGVYGLRKHGSSIKIQHRFKNTERTVPAHVVQTYTFTKLYIDQNWSDQSAMLKASGGLLNLSIALLWGSDYEGARAKTPPTKRRRLEDAGLTAVDEDEEGQTQDGHSMASHGTCAESEVGVVPPPPAED